MPTSPLTATPLPARTLLRQIGALAVPTTALSMLQVGAQLVETVLAARQGTAALAGWAVMLPFVLLLAQGISEIIKKTAIMRGVIDDPNPFISAHEAALLEGEAIAEVSTAADVMIPEDRK